MGCKWNDYALEDTHKGPQAGLVCAKSADNHFLPGLQAFLHLSNAVVPDVPGLECFVEVKNCVGKESAGPRVWELSLCFNECFPP